MRNIEFLEPEPTMDIRSPEGSKVVFMNKNGHKHEPEGAIDAGLVEGETYTVDHTDVYGWITYVYLKEFPDTPFNSVMFANK